MCLIGFALHAHPEYPLIIASNRDEEYHRPTLCAHWWDAGFVAGKDLEQGGTWLAVAKDGRFAAVTNFRGHASYPANTRSRGELVVNFLSNNIQPEDYLEIVSLHGKNYRGFNLVVGSPDELRAYSNINDQIIVAEKGIHALSNAFFNTEWPKVSNLKAGMAQVLRNTAGLPSDALFKLLANSETAPDWALPSTGIDQGLERSLSSAFIAQDGYGTRASTMVAIKNDGTVVFEERSFIPELQKIKLEFSIDRGAQRSPRNIDLVP